MAQYKSYFSTIYDRMMDDIPYEEWKEYLLLLMRRYGVAPGSKLLEVGCGTGNMSEKLAAEGYEVTGIDLSEDMLEIARAKQESHAGSVRNPNSEEGCSVTYLHADMRSFALPEKQAAAVSVGDSMNYLLTLEDFTAALTAIHDNLEPGGIFIFDLKTEYFFKNSYDGMTFADDLGDFSYIWKNYYDDEKHIHEYHLKFKIRTDADTEKISADQPYRIERELHRQRTYSAAEIKAAAEKAGFRKAAAFESFTLKKSRKNSERIHIVCHD